MRLKSLTNVRPVKDQGTQIIAAPTKGGFKVSDGAATRLGVTKGDYIDIAEHPSQPGTFFVGKGFEGNDDVKGNGSKLGRSGSYLTASAAAAWQKMGDTEHNTAFDLSEEGIEVEVEHSDEPVMYYELLPAGKEPKQSSGDDATEQVQEAPQAQEAVSAVDELDEL
jgi:hypothetical protein